MGMNKKVFHVFHFLSIECLPFETMSNLKLLNVVNKYKSLLEVNSRWQSDIFECSVINKIRLHLFNLSNTKVHGKQITASQNSAWFKINQTVLKAISILSYVF